MTYCLGVLVHDGLVVVADTRMSAGPDNLLTYNKLHFFCNPGERALVLASSGNLSVSQAVISLLAEGIEDEDTGETHTLMNQPTMFRAAQLIGRALRQVRATDAESFDWARVAFDVSFLFGGQIKGSQMKLYMIYPAGNFIEAGDRSRFLQIGEHKFGKSILSRAVHRDIDLYDALKLGLISMDDALRSNAEVGLPIDLLVLRGDTMNPEVLLRIEEDDPYFSDLRERWSAALRAAHSAIPRPPYGSSPIVK
jgi:putative proteasome-type protease